MSKGKKDKIQPKSNNTQTSNTTSVTSSGNFSLLAAGFAVAIILVTWFAYRGATDNQFVNWDDQVYVTENPLMAKPSPENAARIWEVIISNNFHPLTMWSLYKNVQSSGIKPGPIINGNIWIHILNSLLVFLFFGMLTRGRWVVAGFTGLIFAIHPMHVESVAWVSERKDVMYVFFGMLSLIIWLQYVRKQYNMGWLALTLGFLALSCLSKAMAVVFPILYLLVDYWEQREFTSARVWIEKVPLFAISLLFGLIAMSVQKGGNFHGWFDNIEIRNALTDNQIYTGFDKVKFAGYGLLQYLIKLLVPTGLCTYYPYPPKAAVNSLPYISGLIFFLLYLGALVWAYVRSVRVLFWGLAFNLVSVALVLQFVSVGSVIMADRYTYLPYAGLIFAILYLLFEKTRSGIKQQIAIAALSIFTLTCAWMTTKQVEVWQDSITLWTRVVDLHPDAADAYTKRGTSWGKERNDLTKAKADFDKAIALNPQEPNGYEGLGIVAGMQNDHVKALEMFEKCVQLKPDYHNFHFNLAIAYLQNKQPAKSLPHFEKAIALNSGNYDKYVPGYIDALFNTGDFTKAIQQADGAIAKGVKTAGIYLVKAQAQQRLGNLPAAQQDLQQVLTLDPKNAFVPQLKAAWGIK